MSWCTSIPSASPSDTPSSSGEPQLACLLLLLQLCMHQGMPLLALLRSTAGGGQYEPAYQFAATDAVLPLRGTRAAALSRRWQDSQPVSFLPLPLRLNLPDMVSDVVPPPPPTTRSSLLTQEGICLTLDPAFHFLEVSACTAAQTAVAAKAIQEPVWPEQRC